MEAVVAVPKQLSLLTAQDAAPAARGLAGGRDEVEALLAHHAGRSSGLADRLAGLEDLWLRFAEVSTGEVLLPTLAMIERLERLRSGMIEEMQRSAALLQEAPPQQQGKVEVNVHGQHAGVLVAPHLRRADQAK